LLPFGFFWSFTTYSTAIQGGVMAKPVITNFAVRKLTNSNGELDQAKRLWKTPEFIATDDFWHATFDVDGVKREAGIRLGRRVDVAEDLDGIDINLRINEAEFDADNLIPESDVADIVRAVQEKFLGLAGLDASGRPMTNEGKFQCPALVDSSPHGQCIRVEGHPGEHVTATSAQGGYSCPRCKKLFASIEALDAHVPCLA
jgi:hypothetical protein